MLRLATVASVMLMIVQVISQEPIDLNQEKFPDDFIFGVATASYQIEGAWDTNGKGENVWDHFTHNSPHRIRDNTNGDIACDSYHKYKEDIKLVKDLGVQLYRFSLSWSRILPTGFSNSINPDGIKYYNNVLDEIIANGIIPMVTLFHWDLPQPLQDLGGWSNPLMLQYFEDYARIAFENFGDRVQFWLTFNEPKQTCKLAYGDVVLAPALNSTGIADYLCTHTLLKSHGTVYRMFYDEFKNVPNSKIPTDAKISITMDTFWFEPMTDKAADIEAAQRAFQFQFGLFAHPIFSKDGDYPEVVKTFVKNRSLKEGFKTSRLPELTADEIALIHGTGDYIGLNFYTAIKVEDHEFEIMVNPSLDYDTHAMFSYDAKWETAKSTWLKKVPWGFRKALEWIKNEYDNKDIIITENGFSDEGTLKDCKRVEYFQEYLSALLEAIHIDKVNVIGYTAWSLLDNFEWTNGFAHRFGLHHVDFSSSSRTRTPKESARQFASIVKNKKLPEKSIDLTDDEKCSACIVSSSVLIILVALSLLM